MASAPVIADIRPLLLRAPLERPIVGPFGRLDARPNLLVEVETRSGAIGLGEIWANFPSWGCMERIDLVRHAIRPALVGEPIDDPVRLYRKLHRLLEPLARQWAAPGPVHQAIAGTDIAVWDALARERGVPLAELAGGRPAPDRVAVYASGIAADRPGEVVAEARAHGHRRYKIRLSFGLERDRATLRDARAAAGEAPLMADCNQSHDPASLAALGDDLRDARLGWLEEPFPVDDDAAYRGYPQDPRWPPLALGENAYGADGLGRVQADYRPAVLQPDITKTAGISEGLTIGRAAVAAGRRLCLHMFGGSVGLYASAHLAAAIAGSDWVEMDANPNPLYDAVLDCPPGVLDGALVLTGLPGLGVDLDRGAIRSWIVAP